MIFERAAQREFARTAAAVFVALFVIMLTTQLIRLLGQAASGETASEAVAALLGFAAINYLPVLLTQTLFIAILLTLSRAYRDSEMAVWFSCGVPLTQWVRPVLRFALPVVAVIAGLTLFLAPWAYEKRDEYQENMDRRGDVARVTPGAFRESASGDRIFFVESVADADDASGHVKNVFISSIQHGRLGVMVAAHGEVKVDDNGDKFVVLTNGRRYEGEPGSSELRIMEFASYAIRMESKESGQTERGARNLATLELVGNWIPLNQGELLWRIGIPLSALILALLAIPLSFVNPRSGRTANLLFALLTFMIYSNLLSISRAWVVQGKVHFAIAVWSAHLLMFAVLILLFWKRLAVFSIWRRR